jgi:hypothetical protein
LRLPTLQDESANCDMQRRCYFAKRRRCRINGLCAAVGMMQSIAET